MGYLYVFITIILTIYGQLILKWRMNQMPDVPTEMIEKFKVLFFAIFDPYIFSSFAAAFIASLTWMAALREFEISKAYPMMALSFVGVTIISYFMFNESFNWMKVVGTILVVAGVIVISKSS